MAFFWVKIPTFWSPKNLYYHADGYILIRGDKKWIMIVGKCHCFYQILTVIHWQKKKQFQIIQKTKFCNWFAQCSLKTQQNWLHFWSDFNLSNTSEIKRTASNEVKHSLEKRFTIFYQHYYFVKTFPWRWELI